MIARLAAILAHLRRIDWRDVGGLGQDEAGAWRVGLAQLERAEAALAGRCYGDAFDCLEVAIDALRELPDMHGECNELAKLRDDVGYLSGAVEESLEFLARKAMVG